MSDIDCLFCRMVEGEVPADVVAETATVLAFRDINPQAPTHVLVIPKQHFADVVEAAHGAPEVLGEMAQVAEQVAQSECGGQFRWIFNTGESAGQSVFHLHGHVIGGQELGWNPA